MIEHRRQQDSRSATSEHGRTHAPRWRFVVQMAALLCSSGCQTWHKSHEAALISYTAGDLAESHASLTDARQALRAEQHLLALEEAMLQLARGETSQAETLLRHEREELELLQQADAAEQTASILSDRRAIAWSGRAFERQMVLNLALLASLSGDRQDSFAWSMQLADQTHARMTELAKAAERSEPDHAIATSDASATATVSPVGFESATALPRETVVAASASDQALALGTYLAAVVQSERATRSDETERCLTDLAVWNPDFARVLNDPAGSHLGVRCQPGHGAVHIIALVGHAPRWVSESAEPTSAALLIADRIISATGKHTLPPTIAAVKIARPEFQSALLPVTAMRAAVLAGDANGQPQAELTFVTAVDLQAAAQSCYLETRDEEIARAVSRRVLKKGAVYVLKETQKVHRNSLVDLGINVAGVAWEALEKADTRSWRLLPARVDVARTELPAGNWELRLGPATARPVTVTVPVADGRNTTVVCFLPDTSLVGNILIGGPERRVQPVTESNRPRYQP